jgi:hypothetical protein
MPNLVVKRLTSRLIRDDREDIQAALLEYVLEEEADCTKLRPDHYLLAKLLPYLNQVSTNWKGLAKNVEWVGSSAHKHCLEYLKNQLRFKGKYLQKRVDAVNQGQSDHDDEQPEDDDQDTIQPTPQKGKHAKRGPTSDVDDTPAAPAQPAPAKKQKTEQQYDDASIVAQGPSQPTHITLMRDPTDDISDVFHQLRKISSQIKQKRQDTEVLYNQWLSLYA